MRIFSESFEWRPGFVTFQFEFNSVHNFILGFQITATREEMHDWGLRAQEITWRFIEKTLKDMALIS